MKNTMVVYGDSIHDDTEALQAFIDGKARLIFPDGKEFKGIGSGLDEAFSAPGARFKVSKTLRIGREV